MKTRQECPEEAKCSRARLCLWKAGRWERAPQVGREHAAAAAQRRHLPESRLCRFCFAHKGKNESSITTDPFDEDPREDHLL